MPQPSRNATQVDVPSALYTNRLTQCRLEAKRLQRQHILLGYLRLLWVIAAAVLAWFIFGSHALRWPFLFLPLVGFGVTARWHSRILAQAAQAHRAVAWYEHGLARLEDRWAGLRPRPPVKSANESLYAGDLDLFGPGSLFELVCTARTSLGEDTLASWLLQAASPDEIRARQDGVRDLRDRVPLREAMARAEGPAQSQLETSALTDWGTAMIDSVPQVFRWLAPLLALLTLAAAVRWMLGYSPAPLSIVLLLNGTITFALQRRFKPLFEQAETAARPLRLLANLFAVLEKESFSSARAASAQASFRQGSIPASEAMKRLTRLAGAVEQRANFLSRILDFTVLYSVHVALSVGRWRTQYGPQMGSWFRAFGDLEALLALSAYHFEHPEDAFPELTTEISFQAEALGHPLLGGNRCVRNDLSLHASAPLLIVSGSNMSGKSTLMRATGVACVMAMAGAPVRARRLRLGPLHVAASIQVQDSLQAGHSRFYAEILRLRAICDLARTDGPVLFLLDELLAGTNSHDRLAGATGVIEALLKAGALGLLSTHDLALTQLRADLQGKVRNAHFEDRIEGGGLQFDYTLREGIITRSNGLDLMRLIGLEV